MKAAVALGCEKINMVSQLILFPSSLWQTVAKQMMASMRGVRAYLKFCQEHSFTCHWLLIYSLDGPILFLWYQFLLTLLTTSFNESLYNYDCWWPVTQTWRGCHYMNIKVIHRDVGVEDLTVAAIPPTSKPSLKARPSPVWLYPFKYPFSSKEWNIGMYQSGMWCMQPWNRMLHVGGVNQTFRKIALQCICYICISVAQTERNIGRSWCLVPMTDMKYYRLYYWINRFINEPWTYIMKS